MSNFEADLCRTLRQIYCSRVAACCRMTCEIFACQIQIMTLVLLIQQPARPGSLQRVICRTLRQIYCSRVAACCRMTCAISACIQNLICPEAHVSEPVRERGLNAITHAMYAVRPQHSMTSSPRQNLSAGDLGVRCTWNSIWSLVTVACRSENSPPSWRHGTVLGVLRLTPFEARVGQRDVWSVVEDILMIIEVAGCHVIYIYVHYIVQ